MLERELKLFIPLPQQSTIIAAVQQLPATQQLRLAAHYFDTPQRGLAQQGAALRLRLEGSQWVQTLKIQGDDAFSNVEYNHIRPSPNLDLNLYENTAAANLFTQLHSPLEMRYQTDVLRTTVLIHTAEAEIELALDLGVIKAKEHTLLISEVEFELKQGEMADVFSTALTWLKKFNLLLELRSKSERGDTLYEYALQNPDHPPLHGAQAALAIAQSPYRLAPITTATTPALEEAYTAGASNFLSQVIRNAAFVAAIDGIDAPKKLQASYLMLMRVGIRRLHSCRQLFKPWLSEPEQQLAKTLRSYYKAFGLWRDNDMLWLELQPKLVRAGLPAAEELASPHPHEESRAVSAQVLAASAEFQTLLVQSLASVVLGQALDETETTADAAQEKLHQRLNKWLVQIQKQSEIFEQLKPAAQHRLRNRVKRLRYNLEVFGYQTNDPLYTALSKAQNQLGDLCDAYVTRDWYKEHAVNKKQKQFAYNWLEDEISKNQTKSKKTLTLLLKQHLR